MGVPRRRWQAGALDFVGWRAQQEVDDRTPVIKQESRKKKTKKPKKKKADLKLGAHGVGKELSLFAVLRDFGRLARWFFPKEVCPENLKDKFMSSSGEAFFHELTAEGWAALDPRTRQEKIGGLSLSELTVAANKTVISDPSYLLALQLAALHGVKLSPDYTDKLYGELGIPDVDDVDGRAALRKMCVEATSSTMLLILSLRREPPPVASPAGRPHLPSWSSWAPPRRAPKGVRPPVAHAHHRRVTGGRCRWRTWTSWAPPATCPSRRRR